MVAPEVTRESIIADMEREIAEAIERAFMRLDALSASGEPPVSPSPDEPLPLPPD